MAESTALEVVGTKALATLNDLEVSAAGTMKQYAQAPNSKRAYDSDWKLFEEWCGEYKLTPLPATPKTVCLWLEAVGPGYAVKTLARKLSSISVYHKKHGFETPTAHEMVKDMLRSQIRKKLANEESVEPAKKAALTVDELRRMVFETPDNLMGLRDRALVLLGFSGAFRRSELVNLNVGDLKFKDSNGGQLVATLRFSKGNQTGKTEKKYIGYAADERLCPVRTLRLWLDESGITRGPVFRGLRRGTFSLEKGCMSGVSVGRIIKKMAARVGLDPKEIGGHSLRSGFITAGFNMGVPAPKLAKVTGHKSIQTMCDYYQDSGKENLTAKIGL